MIFGLFASSLFLKLVAMLGGSAPRTAFLYSGVLLGIMALALLIPAIRPTREQSAHVAANEEELVAN